MRAIFSIASFTDVLLREILSFTIPSPPFF
nr:MAG TPA: hypothetical protein [Caudoviricetes sp.]DAX72612.1 MAG TPA: hypothetical protein [Caudoviricetes sp.]